MLISEEANAENASTSESRLSAGIDGFSLAMLALALGAGAFCVTLTIRSYMSCPWLDGWRVIADIARGSRPWSFAWLWSQHSEHRIVIPRLLIWLDWAVFGGKNISLFIEMYAAQTVQLAGLCYAVERLSRLPKALRRMTEGVFAFCLFHPYQAQNFTWAFQVAFVLPFAIGAVVLLALAHFEKIPHRWRAWALVGIGLAPLLAAMNLASGLLIGPVAVALAYSKRLPRWLVVTLGVLSAVHFGVYFYGYRTPIDHPSPLVALTRPFGVLRYSLGILDTTWPLFAIGALSLVSLAVCAIVAVRHRERVSDLEWFCFAQCALMLATAALTACGRMQYGIAQGGEGRYQTLAVHYWASLFTLVLIAVWRWQPASLGFARLAIPLIAASCIPFLPSIWTQYVSRADLNKRSCSAVLRGGYSGSDVTQLDFLVNDPGEIRRAASVLRKP